MMTAPLNRQTERDHCSIRIGPMRIGILSDTHGHVPNTQRAVRMLESLDVERVIHCGDIGSVNIVTMFSAWPTHFVLGNVDSNGLELQQAIEQAGQTYHGRFGEVEWAGRRLAFLHGDNALQFRSVVDCGDYAMVCYGHTHVADTKYRQRTLVLNPGAIYRARPHSLAIVELADMQATIVPID
jgi:putative phosphoesterase